MMYLILLIAEDSLLSLHHFVRYLVKTSSYPILMELASEVTVAIDFSAFKHIFYASQFNVFCFMRILFEYFEFCIPLLLKPSHLLH